MEKFSQRIWKGCKVLATDAIGMASGLAILWQPHGVLLSDWRENKFFIFVDFSFPGSEVKGTVVNIYGSSAFPQKHAFLDFLGW